MAERPISEPCLDSRQLAANFSDLHTPLSMLQASQEAARCLYCFDAPCTEACPTGIDIPGFIHAIGSGDLTGAATTILRDNIMGGTCARVCPVEELCEQACVKVAGEQRPVAIGRLQRHATDHLFWAGLQPFRRAAASGRRVAVVGAGPAGLACAHRLAQHGHEISVFEARPKAGGLNEYGIAAYKVVDEWAVREVEFILSLGGIRMETSKRMGSDFTLDELRRDFNAVFLGMGLDGVNRPGLENEDVAGVHDAVAFIERIRQEPLASLPVGRQVIVLGGGNTAIDMAVQMRKLGAESVTLVYRRALQDMRATEYERELAQKAGVLIRCHAQAIRILAQQGQLRAVEFADTRGDLTGERFTLPADQLFLAIGQRFTASAFEGSVAPAMSGDRIRVDAQRATSIPGVWAGGDCVPGPDLTVTAVQDGKLAAEAMHRFLSELP